MNNTSLLGIFLTGLLTGGLTCMAVQGGLLAATIALREEGRLVEKVKNGGAVLPIAAFLAAKLIAYTLLGFLLGLFGSLFKMSLTAQVILQFAVAIFMIGTAFNILNIHPIFRYFVIQPPRFLTRLVREQSKSRALFAPALLGAFTVFIPCGTTQAMMALAIASGNAFYGAAVLFAFVLGTSPIFFLLGYFATKLGDSLHKKFMRIAAFAIIILAIFNLNNAIALSGSRWTFGNIAKSFWCTFTFCKKDAVNSQQTGVIEQNPTIFITNGGYSPAEISIKKGSQVDLILKNTGGQGCNQTFTIPSLGIQKTILLGKTDSIQFTAPKNQGDISFMCVMGMYRGVIHVI